MTPTREALDDQLIGLPGGRVVKGCCPAHVGARNRAERRAADRTCSLAKLRRRR